MSRSYYRHTGSVDHNREEDNVKEQQQQENELCGKDTTPLIRKTDSEVPNGNQAKDSEQIKNIPEGIKLLNYSLQLQSCIGTHESGMYT